LKEKPVKYAAVTGVAIVLATVAVFLLYPQPQIVGSNNLSRRTTVVPLYEGQTYCQRLPGTPDGAGFVRIGVGNGSPLHANKFDGTRTELGQVRGISITIEAAGAHPIRGKASDFTSGRVDVPLRRPTPPSSKAKICIRSRSHRTLSLYGEPKFFPDGRIEGRVAITFLDADKGNLLSRLKLIARRHGFAHAGIIGSWALVPAALFFLIAGGFAFWLAVRGPTERRDPQP
jgi:hypothetical protein